jgi:hypothetical protein
MKTLFSNARLACLSFLCLLAAFILFWMLVHTGTNHRLGSTMDAVARFAALSPALIAIVLSLAGLRWDRRKTPGVIALIAALAGTCAIFSMGG